jgi:hypothetical protein
VVFRFGSFGATKVKISPYLKNEKPFHFIGEASAHTILSGNHTLQPDTQTYFFPYSGNHIGSIHTKTRHPQHKSRQKQTGHSPNGRRVPEHRKNRAATPNRDCDRSRIDRLATQDTPRNTTTDRSAASVRRSSSEGRNFGRKTETGIRPSCENAGVAVTDKTGRQPRAPQNSECTDKTVARKPAGFRATNRAIIAVPDQIAPEIRKTAATVRMA